VFNNVLPIALSAKAGIPWEKMSQADLG